ncbi:MAG: hypothetical protein QGH23_00055, partial [Dehalococcoidia bacterium]|nr:hypothetical protein [Dehalococcoidia bacterium]
VSLMERMAPGPLLEEPNLWPSLHPMFSFFQARYRAFYTGFHQQHQREVAQLRVEMEKALPKLLALGRLNFIAELGPAVGEGLKREYHEILSSLNPCIHKELPADDPLCPACGLAAPATPPSARVDSIIHRLDGALAQQQARLSSRAVRQILQSGGPRLEQFLKVLRAGGPSPLVGVLDDEVVAFLRQLLAESQAITVKSSSLAELQQKYPHLEESQVDEALAWLAEELRHSFQAAYNQNPGKPVRLTWEQ